MTMPSRRRLLAAAAVAVLLLATILALVARRPPASLVTAVARRGELVIDVATVGQVEAVKSRSVSRQRTSFSWDAVQIAQMAPEGSVVAQGDFLVQLDQSTTSQQLEQVENSLLNARAELARRRAEIDQRLAELESARLNQEYGYEQTRLRYDLMAFEAEVRRREQELELKKAELSLREAGDRLAAQRIIAEAELAKAQYDVRNAEMQVAQAREALASLTITAPEPGLVVYKTFRGGKIKVGDQVWPGMELIDLPDLSQMQVRTRVNEIDVRQIAVDQEVAVAVDALAGREFRGKVTRIATLARAEGEAKVKVFDVDVLIEGEAGDLRPGMTAQCRIIVARLADVVTVPLEAVFERDGGSVVYAVDGRVAARPVVLGERNDDFVVIESGLEAGATVSLRDPQQPLPAAPDKDAAREAKP
ncbi:MAG: efflux RND transporter periplasmic adaptor subunit [bacterium]|nr:efflux RND transporter periplasmic adaptor subunit [bacterium]